MPAALQIPSDRLSSSPAAGQLEAVGDIEDNRIAKGPHDRECPEINHQIIVSERCPPFGYKKILLPVEINLSMMFFMSQGARNWPFFDIYRLAGLRCCKDQVGLPAEEGRDLENIKHFRCGFYFIHRMDIGQNRHIKPALYIGKGLNPLSNPGPLNEDSEVLLALS